MTIIPVESAPSFVTALARWLAPPSKGETAATLTPSTFEAECLKLEVNGDLAGLSGKLRAALAARVATGTPSDLRTAYTILFELLVQWQLLAAEAEAVADELCGAAAAAAVAALPPAEQQLRCVLLLALYGAVQQHGILELRFKLLLRLIGFSAATRDLHKVLGEVEERVPRVERWVAEWELTHAQQKQIWGLVFDAHAADSRLSYECALKYFSLHETDDLASLPQLKERIVQGLLTTIGSPDLFRCDELSQLPVVQQLKSDATLAPLHRLLQIMACETFATYLAFCKDAASAAFMREHALSADECARKMRLLTLVSLGHASKELSYDAIATALQIEVDEVESWVMQAIGSGLMAAKMDQVREVVAVSSCAERGFGKKEWQRLHVSLVDWCDSIRTLLDVLKASRGA